MLSLGGENERALVGSSKVRNHIGHCKELGFDLQQGGSFQTVLSRSGIGSDLHANKISLVL